MVTLRLPEQARQPGRAAITPHGNDPDRIERLRAMRAEARRWRKWAPAEHISRERIRQICQSAGIDTSPNYDFDPEQHAAVEEYLAGGSLNLVSARYGGRHARIAQLDCAGRPCAAPRSARRKTEETIAPRRARRPALPAGHESR
jgi:hypothetical protein